MTSLLQLDTHCLLHLLQFLDINSLRSVMMVCKRLMEIATDSRHWRTSVHRARSSYFLIELFFESCQSSKGDAKEVVDRAVEVIADIQMLSDQQYNKVFDMSGPVVAKLFTMIRKPRSQVESGEPRAACTKIYNSFELHLPCGRHMNVSGSFFHDSGFNYDNVLTVNIKIEGKEYSCEIHNGCHPEDAFYFPQELTEFQNSFNDLKRPFDMIQDEIGITQPALTPAFFYWFANMDWSSPSLNCPDYAEKIIFKDSDLNTKEGKSKSMIKPYRESACAKWVEEMQTWKTKFLDDKAASAVVESVGILIKRAAESILRSLQFDLGRISSIRYYMTKYKTKVVKAMIRSTIFNLKPNEWNGSIADKFVQEFIGVHSNHGVVEITMNSRNDGSSYPQWESFCLKYKLPDGVVYSIDTEDYASKKDRLRDDRILSDHWYLPSSSLEKLSALTSIFQGNVGHVFGNSENVPNVTNAFVLSYLVVAMAFARYGCDPDEFPETYLKHLKNDWCSDTEKYSEDD